MKSPLLLLLLLFPLPTFAETKVFYFGGHGFSRSQADRWVQCAKSKRPNVNFQAFQFRGVWGPPDEKGKPAKPWSAQQSIEGAREFIPQVVAEINANPEKQFLVVGHSSGSAISTEIVSQVKDFRHVKLVDLDGFFPGKVQNRPGVQVMCYWARNQDGVESMNSNSMKGNCKNKKMYQDNHCETRWCLHFVLTMRSTPSDLSENTYAANGYQGCDVNLSWLEAD